MVAEYNGSSQLQRTYVTPGLDNNLTMTASGSTYYYLSDALGSIRQLIDALTCLLPMTTPADSE